jgi:hypothetical protein
MASTRAAFDWLTGRHSHDVAPASSKICVRRAFTTANSATPTATPTAGAAARSWSTGWWTNGSSAWASSTTSRASEVTPKKKRAACATRSWIAWTRPTGIPSFGYDRELDWLRNMHDWMISKKRYWGLALPIWECDECGHFTSLADEEELEERAVEGWEDVRGHSPHRPLYRRRQNRLPALRRPIERIKDVGNPVARRGHRRLQHPGLLRHRPGLLGQMVSGRLDHRKLPRPVPQLVLQRCWPKAPSWGKAPFLNLFGYATLLAEDGREMHKSWGNSIEFNEAPTRWARHDALALRQLQAGAKPALRLPSPSTRRAAASSSRSGTSTASSSLTRNRLACG